MSATPEQPTAPVQSVESADAVRVCLLLGRILFNFGATAQRIQDSVAFLARHLGCEVHMVVGYDALLITVESGATFRTRIDSADRLAALNLIGLTRVSAFLRSLPDSPHSVEEIEQALQAIRDTPGRHSATAHTLAAGCAGAAFCIVNGGDPKSWVCSFVAGAAIFALRRRLTKHGFNFHVTIFAVTLAGSFLAGLLARLTHAATPAIALVAPVLFLVPGVPMINGGIEIVRNHVTIGISRVGFTMAVIVALCLGVGLTLPILPLQINPAFSMPGAWKIVLMSFAGAVAAGALACLNNGSLSGIGICAIGGLIGRLVRAMASLAGLDLITASLIGAIAGTLLVGSIAQRLRRPAVVVSVMAALPMVPGYFFIDGLHALLSFAATEPLDVMRLSAALQALLRALFISVALIVGVIGPVTLLQRDAKRI
jgi:uncharacterized membrane protein YjjP (DUF1212 family)